MSYKNLGKIKIHGEEVTVWRNYENNFPFPKRIYRTWEYQGKTWSDKDRLKRYIAKQKTSA